MGYFARPHQNEAIEATHQALELSRRATVLMCCASGKTLVGTRLAARHRRVLILEPSLPLISQTLRVAREDGLCEGRTVVCVCSDKTVTDYDAWQVTEDDLGIPVTTNPAELRSILNCDSRPLLVFCTYQSQHLLRDVKPDGWQWDLIVSDEAHRTAGSIDRQFSLALEDHHIPAGRRLFLTGTARFIAPLAREEDSAQSRSYSMDDPNVYGPVSYELPYPEAIRRGIVCDYQLLVSTVLEADVRSALSQRTKLLIPQSKAPLDLIAGQLSVIKTFQQTNAHRIITFHRTIEQAEVFTQDPAQLYAEARIGRFHIHGDMRTAERTRVINEYLDFDGPALMSNARCLTEGVDIPQVDGVAFMDVRESTIDLAQAIGRALRPFPTKRLGYIMVPLYMDAAVESAEEAYQRGDLAVMFDVLHSLLDADEVLAERLWDHVRSIPEAAAVGRRGQAKLRVLASTDLQSALIRSIAIRAIDRLGNRWDDMYAAAQSFRRREGHLLVPREHGEGDLPLGAWIAHQQLLHRQSRLSAQRVHRLNELGMAWTAAEQEWSRHYIAMAAFRAESGHFHLGKDPKYDELRKWASRVRRLHSQGTLSPARTAALAAIQFPWSYDEGQWNFYLQQIRAIRKSRPQGAIPTTGGYERLADYIQVCRKRYRAGSLDEERAEVLRSLGVAIDRTVRTAYVRKPNSWNAHYDALKKYIAREGSTDDLGKSHREGGYRICAWLNSQRVQRRAGVLSPERKALLDKLNISWDPTSESWERNFATLRTIRAKQGHQRLSRNAKLGRLSKWISQQRTDRERGKLSAERRAKLDGIQFAWSREEERWQYYVHQLSAFRARHGDREPRNRSGEYGLYEFLAAARKRYEAGILAPKQVSILASLGVAWARRRGGAADALAG
jgi:superfamily II DNA or RNA helicase